MLQQNRSLVLRRRPQGKAVREDFELVTTAIEFPPPPAQQPADSGGALALVKNLYVSVDPAHRIWISDKNTAVYVDPVPLDSVMRALTLGVVVQTTSEDEFPVGTHVVGVGGVQEYYVGGTSVGVPLLKVPDGSTKYLSACSVHIGFTAWHGVHNVLQIPVKSDSDHMKSDSLVVVVSGAAGAVGSLAGQLAKLSGATQVIGIAGGPEKCRDLVNFYGFDHAVDYKNENVEQTLATLAPEGVHCYFDNVGGAVTDAVLRNMRRFGRVAVCGSISEYNDSWTGIRNWNLVLQKRLTVQGYICGDHIQEFATCFPELCALEEAGKIRYKEDIRDGIENYVDVLNLLFTGENTGKLMIRV